MQNPRIVSEPHAGLENISFVREAIIRRNVAVTRETYYSPLAILLKDEPDAVLGGAFGHVWGGWLDLSLLWVAEPLRGQGTESGSRGRLRKRRVRKAAGASS